jgi:hypothetical protein
MNNVTSSATPLQYCYEQKAVGEFSWDKHKHKNAVESKMLTISPTLQAFLLNERHISLRLVGKPIAGLDSKQSISDSYNQGPYMDILSYSIKPKQKGIVSLDDSVGTAVKEIFNSTQNTETFNAGLAPSVNYQGVTMYGGIGNLNYSSNTASTHQSKTHEFEEMEYLDGDKRTVVYNMTKCYWGEAIKSYNTSKVWSLRRSQLDKRLTIGFTVPFYGWFGGWQDFPDTTYTPPLAATTSFGAVWSLDYFIPKTIDSIEFEWITEVRTIFASNRGEIPRETHCYDTLNWIKTIHQVKQSFKVEIGNHDIQLEALSIEEKRACISGVRKRNQIRKANR